MSKQPPAKRKRVEPLAITGSPKLWFDDGSVVLQAQNTQFRVHCGVLSHSSVFCDMRRGLPQPPDQNVVEGCTVVVLTDSAVDVETLLETFHHPPFSVAAVPLFCIIAAQLRLGRKYKLRTPFIHASVRLGFTNPTKREQYVVAQKQRRSFDPSCVYNIFPHDGILFDTLTLARENKLLSALPCAYYRVVAKHSQEEISNGPGEDGTLITLSLEDQQICILARPKLVQAQFESGHRLRQVPAQPDAGRGGSGVAAARLSRGILGDVRKDCSSCVDQAMDSVSDLEGLPSEKIWQALPSFFNLPPWDELK
ncbi:hypothetical protein C8R47DRAFT_976289 [Mycena vitilis]|nr:hypothetical protein C8R47DRAFT_976289 [Mycena vitilis]